MDDFIKFLTQPMMLMALVVLVVILVVYLILRNVKKGRFKKELSEFEVRYNTIKSIPLPFKINKAVAIARVNQEVMQSVTQSKDTFEMVQSNLKQISRLLANGEDYLVIGKFKDVKQCIEELEDLIVIGEKQVNELNDFLDTILEKETAQRSEVTKLKDQFRILKQEAKEKSASLSFSWKMIEKEIFNTEKLFSTFEEWMYASEFEKATESLEAIHASIESLNAIIKTLPELLTQARGSVPALRDDVMKNYEMAMKKKIFLGHLEVEKNIALVNDTLNAQLEKLKNGKGANVQENLDDCVMRLRQMNDLIAKERASHDELLAIATETAELLAKSKENADYIDTQYEKVSVRFGLDNLSKEMDSCKNRLSELNDSKDKIISMIETGNIPSTTILISLVNLQKDAGELSTVLKVTRDKLDSVTGDEERAKKQLIKLQLIMNEIQVKIRQRKLPMISSNYEGDLRQAYEYIHSIEGLIGETPLNVSLLNATLSDAIDFIYQLYNNVNNVVGMAIMVENTIVFGNKYRSTYSEIDSELTRAELCFRNGEYTQALTIAISTIERIFPNNYESIIKENAKSAS